MRHLLVLAALLPSLVVSGDEPWGNLTVVPVDRSCVGDVEVRYDPQLLVALENRVIVDPDSQMKEVEIMAIRLSTESEPVFLSYSEGASCDPTFLVFPSSESRSRAEPIGDLWALTLIVPGDGALYARGHTNNYFSHTKKYELRGGRLEEVRQPMYYAGLETVAQRPIRLLSSRDADDAVVQVEVGEKLTLVACDEDDWCLVKTRHGLLGWLKLEYANEGEEPLRGVLFAGD